MRSCLRILLVLVCGYELAEAQSATTAAAPFITNLVSKPVLTISTNPTFYLGTGFSQGWAFEGTTGYRLLTGAIVTYSTTNWAVTGSNGNPFSGLSNYNHLGAGTCYQGKLYVAMEAYSGCGSVANQSIGVFNSMDLSRLSVTVVSNYQNEISAVAVAPELSSNGMVFTASFCDGSRLFRYSLPNLSYAGALLLSQTIPSIQGIGYYAGWLFVIADSGPAGLLYAVDPNTGTAHHLATLSAPNTTEYEGLDVSQGEFRVAEANTGLYFYKFETQGAALSFKGVNGSPGGTVYTLCATNISPTPGWTILATNTFDSNGTFDFTSPWSTNAMQFYRLKQ